MLNELKNCTLCEWKCGINRSEGEKGVCMLGKPKVASTTLHPAPPQSYTVFMAGCNFRCLNCQNWSIAHFPEQDIRLRGHLDPKELAKESVTKIRSRRGKAIGADRIFFSGGSPTPNLPYIEKVVEEARKLDEDVKVNYDTNGFLTEESLKRVSRFTDSITFDVKAFDPRTHRELTGAPVEPVLRNAKTIVKRWPEKLWEFRYLSIPGVNEKDVEPFAEFLADIDESLPLNFLAFRPNFVMEDHPGARRSEMISAVKKAESAGLENVSWSGHPGIDRKKDKTELSQKIKELGCTNVPRRCGSCKKRLKCPVKKYRPLSRS